MKLVEKWKLWKMFVAIFQTSILASHPAARVQFPASPIFFGGKIIDVAWVNQQRWLEESGQWLENVDQTHVVQASGKSVLKKNNQSHPVPGSKHEVRPDVSLLDRQLQQARQPLQLRHEARPLLGD